MSLLLILRIHPIYTDFQQTIPDCIQYHVKKQVVNWSPNGKKMRQWVTEKAHPCRYYHNLDKNQKISGIWRSGSSLYDNLGSSTKLL